MDPSSYYTLTVYVVKLLLDNFHYQEAESLLFELKKRNQEVQSIPDEIEIEILRGRCYPTQADKERAFQHLFKADRYMIALGERIEPERLKELQIEYLASLRELQIAGKELMYAHGNIIRTL